MLEVSGVQVVYQDVILALRGVSLSVPDGGFVTLLGANGAGKTTTLKAISGLLRPERGRVTKGTITFDGERIDGRPAADLVRRGIVQVMEGRRVFEHLTVVENLVAGAHLRRRTRLDPDLDMIRDYFPVLGERWQTKAGYLSGGEQQMLAIGRALMARPRLMLLDEPSLGLAPRLVDGIFEIVTRLNRDTGVAVLLVEQNAALALDVAAWGYVMESGRVVLDGSAEKLGGNEDVAEFYLGLSELGRRSYRDVKHYKRRKRWLA
jgi:branched-chain amino acid transport system ATP-binding protein